VPQGAAISKSPSDCLNRLIPVAVFDRDIKAGGLESAPPWSYNRGGGFPGLGRRTSSPPQFGQIAVIDSVHCSQKVHS
jgi:hypothetical protein